jgi:hypothetical protein
MYIDRHGKRGRRRDGVASGHETDELEHRLRERLDAHALGPAPRAKVLLRVLTLPDLDRADRIGSYWGNPATRAFAELLIDCEEDRTLRAVLVGMLREGEGR